MMYLEAAIYDASYSTPGSKTVAARTVASVCTKPMCSDGQELTEKLVIHRVTVT